jgi:hypothetical protein
MTQISGTNARFLNTEVILSEIMRVMEPKLAFLDLIPFVDTGGLPVVYGKKASASSDGLKQTPRMTAPSSRFPEVQISRMTKETAITATEGLSMTFDKAALTLPAGRDIIISTYEEVAYWIAQYMDATIYATLDAGSTDTGMTPSAVWSAAGATPLLDMLNFKNGMIHEGYPYRLTDAFVEGTNFTEMEAYLIASEIPEYRQAVINSPITDEIVLPIEGKPMLHRLLSGIVHGDIMGIDRNHRGAATVYYHNDPQFGTPATINYVTVVNGQEVIKPVPNFGLSTHQFYVDDTHETKVQVWLDTVVKVKDAYGIGTDDSI